MTLFKVKVSKIQKKIKFLLKFKEVFGSVAGAILSLPAVMGELFWSASILAALGTTLAVIIELPDIPTIIASAAIAIGYTLFGGLYAVAYTDVVQLSLIIIGLFLALLRIYITC